MKIKLKNVGKCFLNYTLLILGFQINAQSLKEEPKEIILLIGQSNMAGRAEKTEQDYQVVKNAFLLDSLNQWVPLKSPLNIYSSIRKEGSMQRFNLGYSFAQEVIADEIGRASCRERV